MFDRMTPAAFEMLNTVFNCGYAVREDAAKNQFFVAISPAGNYVITLNLYKVGRDFCKRSFTVPAQLFEDEQVFNVFVKQVFVMDRDTNEDRSARSRELLHTHEFFTGFYGDKESKDVLELFGKIAYMASANWTSIMDTVETCIGYDCNRYLHFVPGVIVSLLDPVADATASDLKLVYKHIIKESLANNNTRYKMKITIAIVTDASLYRIHNRGPVGRCHIGNLTKQFQYIFTFLVTIESSEEFMSMQQLTRTSTTILIGVTVHNEDLLNKYIKYLLIFEQLCRHSKTTLTKITTNLIQVESNYIVTRRRNSYKELILSSILTNSIATVENSVQHFKSSGGHTIKHGNSPK
jgi:hypothetical protein